MGTLNIGTYGHVHTDAIHAHTDVIHAHTDAIHAHTDAIHALAMNLLFAHTHEHKQDVTGYSVSHLVTTYISHDIPCKSHG